LLQDSNKSKTLNHSQLLDSLEEQSRELSTRTVIFHHLIGERLGLNPTDHKCLDVIIRSGTPMTASQLAEETGLSTGAITGVVDRLEKAGYVRRKRDKNDRRLVFINPLLDKAMVKLTPIFDPIKQASRNLYSKYSDEQLTLILDFITNCNKMTQQITTNMKMQNKQATK
jgi:DNA-binding MarR family transcriptional regulator